MQLTRRWTIVVCATVVVFAYAGRGDSQPVLATGSETEETGDGLHRVDPRLMETAWVKPDLNLEHYTKILIMPSKVSFRDVARRYNPRGAGHVSDYPVSERAQDRFRIQFGEVFHEYAAQLKPYEVSKDVGREVLMVQGFLIDVVSGIPPNRSGSNMSFIKRPWEITAMVELRDSMSNEVLARSMDRRRIEDPQGGVFEATQVAQVTSLAMEEWSELLLMRLRELIDVGGGRWSRCQLEEIDCALE